MLLPHWCKNLSEREFVLIEFALGFKRAHNFLQCFVDRNTGFAALAERFVFFFAGGVDAVTAGSFAGVAQIAQNITGGLFEVVNIAESIDVDRHKEVPQMIGLLFAFGREAQQTFVNPLEAIDYS